MEPLTPRGAHQRRLLVPLLPKLTPRSAHKGITPPLRGITPRRGDWPGWPSPSWQQGWMSNSLLRSRGATRKKRTWIFWILVKIGDQVFRAVLDTRATLSVVGQKERYVLRITQATHFCYASTGPLLLLFEPCRRPTKQPRYDTPHQPQTASTHTHTHGSHTAHDPPPRHPHQHEGPHSAHTHTKTKDKGTQGPDNHNQWTPARSGGEPRPRPTARRGKGRGHQTTHHRHTTHRQPHTPAHAEDTPTVPPHHTTNNADTRNTRHTTQHGHRAHPHTPQTHTTKDTPTRETQDHNRRAPVWSGGEPHTTTGSEMQPGVAGSSTQEPPPGVARDQPHHTPATTPPHTTAASGPQPGVAGNRVRGPQPGVGMQVRIRTNSLEFEFAPNSHEFVDRSEIEFATSNLKPP